MKIYGRGLLGAKKLLIQFNRHLAHLAMTVHTVRFTNDVYVVVDYDLLLSLSVNCNIKI